MGMKATLGNLFLLTKRPDNNGPVKMDDRLDDQKAQQIEQEFGQEFREKVANLNLSNEQKMQLQQEIDSAIMKFKGDNRGKFNSAAEYREALGKLIGDTTQKFLDAIQKENKDSGYTNNEKQNVNTEYKFRSLDINADYNRMRLGQNIHRK